MDYTHRLRCESSVTRLRRWNIWIHLWSALHGFGSQSPAQSRGWQWCRPEHMVVSVFFRDHNPHSQVNHPTQVPMRCRRNGTRNPLRRTPKIDILQYIMRSQIPTQNEELRTHDWRTEARPVFEVWPHKNEEPILVARNNSQCSMMSIFLFLHGPGFFHIRRGSIPGSFIFTLPTSMASFLPLIIHKILNLASHAAHNPWHYQCGV